MRKINPKDLVAGETLLVQSLEGIPKLKSSEELQPRLVYFCHDQCETAVKNQLLEGSDAYYIEEHLKEIDSTQLRKRFQDQ